MPLVICQPYVEDLIRLLLASNEEIPINYLNILHRRCVFRSGMLSVLVDDKLKVLKFDLCLSDVIVYRRRNTWTWHATICVVARF